MTTTIFLTIILCLVFWAASYISTGEDEKNIKAYITYPDEVQAYVRNKPELQEQIEKANLLASPSINNIRQQLQNGNRKPEKSLNLSHMVSEQNWQQTGRK